MTGSACPVAKQEVFAVDHGPSPEVSIQGGRQRLHHTVSEVSDFPYSSAEDSVNPPSGRFRGSELVLNTKRGDENNRKGTVTTL